MKTINYYFRLTIFFFAIFSVENIIAQCSAGELQTSDDMIIACAGSSIDAIALNTSFPTLGGYGWEFSNKLGGTGGPSVGYFTLTTSSPNTSFDSGLNGVLSNNNFPPLDGL